MVDFTLAIYPILGENLEYFNPIPLPLLRNMFSIAKFAFPKTAIILNGSRNYPAFPKYI
jgi:hypothetical protein